MSKRGRRVVISPTNKRGQVTVFIIIGILILFIFAGILYITNSAVKTKYSEEGTPILQTVPQQFNPVKVYTENCLQSTGKNGLIILGQQGGYIDTKLFKEFSTSNPTDSEGINLAPAKIPYWHYNSQLNKQNTISLSSLQPKLDYEDDSTISIEAQLDRYVKENLDDCLADYSSFKKAGFDISYEDKKIKTNVGDGFVSFTLNMPLEMEKGKASSEINTFYVKIPLDLKKYYAIADQITQAEKNFTFLEKQALDLIQVFSGVDSDKLPPTSAVTFEMVPTVYWNTVDIEDKLKGMLTSYVPMLRYSSSDNMYRYRYPTADLSDLYQKNYDNMILPLTGGNGLEVSFDYLGWEPYFDINDKGNKVEAQHTAVHFWMLHFGTQNYYTSYDLSYPVLVTIEDPTAFDGEGYSFVFALESNVRNNEPVEDNEDLPRPVMSFSDSMACDDDKRDTGLIKTIVVDSSTGNPVEGVQIGFSIPGQDTCAMGLTDISGIFESKYPAAYGGILNFIKEDYFTNFYPIDTYAYKGNKSAIIGYAVQGISVNENVVELHKFKKIKATIKKKNLEKCIGANCYHSNLFGGGKEAYSVKPEQLDETHTWVYTGKTSTLSGNEQGLVTLTRVGDTNQNLNGQEYTTSVSITGDSEQEITLVPGVYEITGNLILDEEVLIPKEERCSSGIVESIACWDIDGCCYTIDETRLSSYVAGQISWNTDKTYLRIDPDDLYSSDLIEFYVLNQNIKNVPAEPHVRVVEDLQVMGEMERISQEDLIRKGLEPRFN